MGTLATVAPRISRVRHVIYLWLLDDHGLFHVGFTSLGEHAGTRYYVFTAHLEEAGPAGPRHWNRRIVHPTHSSHCR